MFPIINPPAGTLPECLPDVLWPECAVFKKQQRQKKTVCCHNATLLKEILGRLIRDSNSSSIYMEQ